MIWTVPIINKIISELQLLSISISKVRQKIKSLDLVWYKKIEGSNKGHNELLIVLLSMWNTK